MFCGIKHALFLKGRKLFINVLHLNIRVQWKIPSEEEGRMMLPARSRRGGPALCCGNGCWAFLWQRLTHGRRCTRMSHNSELGSLNGTRCTGSTNTAGAKWARAFYFLWSLKYGWRLLVLASPPLSPPPVSLLPAARGAPAQAGICRICSAVSAASSWSGALAGAAVPQPAAYLGARPAAARPPQSFRLHKHLGPTRGWIAAW